MKFLRRRGFSNYARKKTVDKIIAKEFKSANYGIELRRREAKQEQKAKERGVPYGGPTEAAYSYRLRKFRWQYLTLL